jgi:hypothetical protein
MLGRITILFLAPAFCVCLRFDNFRFSLVPTLRVGMQTRRSASPPDLNVRQAFPRGAWEREFEGITN